MLNLAAFAEASVQGIPLIFVVMGLVQWFRKQGVKAVHLERVSLGVGLVVGVGYQVSVLPHDVALPTALAWYTFVFGAVIYGVTLGLLASNIYDTADGIFKKAVGR